MFAAQGLMPDITILLSIEPKKGLERIGGDPDRLESETMAFHEGVYRGYLMLAERFPERIKVVDASMGPDDVWEAVKRHITPVLEQRGL